MPADSRLDKAAAEGHVRGNNAGHSYLVGGGIALMAAAAFMIRDGEVRGDTITIIEKLVTVGGSLAVAGSVHDGYVMRGGRMLESKYVCTYGLFSSIPALDKKETVTEEIVRWNEALKTSSKSRLVRDGKAQIARRFGLSEWHILTIERLIIEPEVLLGSTSINEQFDASFFKTDFWFMWCTTFAFQPWHSAVEMKRALRRLSYMIAGFSRLEGIMRTVYNQYDSMVQPLQHWLIDHGVTFELNTRVTDIGVVSQAGEKTVSNMVVERDGNPDEIVLGADDRMLITLGSMTEASSFGGMDAVPVLNWRKDIGAWALWRKIVLNRPEIGRPVAFANHIDQSKWMSFTATSHEPKLLQAVESITGNVPGEGGLITFPDSKWLLSIVVPHQPHFLGQPEDVSVVWGYGLSVDGPGDFITKPMSSCSSREIMTEVLGHLRLKASAADILGSCTCISCMMPFITSQFPRRAAGDRPSVIPEGWRNLAFMGQFVEVRDDVVFTVEASIWSAQEAVYRLLELNRQPPPVYEGEFDPKLLLHAFKALRDIAA